MTLRLMARSVLPAVFFGVFVFGVAAQEPSRVGSRPEKLSEKIIANIDGLFSRVDRPDTAGAAVGVVRDGRLVFARGYGQANLEHGVANSPSTVFDLASVSKQFCAYAIAMLVVKGKVDLEDDIRSHLPWVPQFAQTIRVRHLVHHTSGLRDWPTTLKVAGWRLDDKISMDDIRWMVRRQRDLNFVPGERYLYSNTGYNLLAALVAKKTGKPYRRWMNDNVFAPLGMTSTHFHDDPDEVIANVAKSYEWRNESWYGVADRLTALGSSSAFSTVEDLAKWVVELDTGKHAGDEVIELMHERGMLNDDREIGYAFGQSRAYHLGHMMWCHSGSWAGFMTDLIRFPKQKLAVIVLANASGLSVTRRSRQIADNFLESNLGLGGGAGGRFTPDSKVPSFDPQDYVGRYVSDELETSYVVEAGLDGVVMRHRRNGVVTLKIRRRDTFSTNTWWASTVKFVRDDEGRVTGLTMTSGRVWDLRFRRATSSKP